jgi:hypothetical protein
LSLPETTLFESFLRSLDFTRQEESPDFLSEIAIPKTIAQDVSREVAESHG